MVSVGDAVHILSVIIIIIMVEVEMSHRTEDDGHREKASQEPEG